MDFISLFLEGIVRVPLATAAHAMTAQLREWIGSGRDLQSFFTNVDVDDAHRDVIEQLRDFACRVVIKPTLVRGEPTGPHEFPVRMLGAAILYALYNFSPPDAIVTRLSEEAADTFRDAPQGAPGGAGSNSTQVRTEAVELAAQSTATRQP